MKDAIRKVDGDSKQKDKVLEYLADVDHRIPLAGGAATGTLDRIETLLKAAIPIETSDEVKLQAADRALNRKAPCHHENKNAMADAVLIETYFECVRKGKAGDRFAFVTHNKHDFSDMAKNQKAAHPDLASGFSKIKSLYFVTLADCVRRIDPVLVQEVIWENSYEQQVRSLSEILDAVDRLTTQVWYNRHKYLAWQIERGKHKLVTRADWDASWQNTKGYSQTHTIDTVWKGALKSAKKAERKLGENNYGPWTDFEWGMINGKLSALRWALGDEWDMLDT
ncbi:MAG: PIN domain-containing protein [Acidobacteriales bacterium]|nr:PIN domain-containing protein [Terriglobales bacterium]